MFKGLTSWGVAVLKGRRGGLQDLRRAAERRLSSERRLPQHTLSPPQHTLRLSERRLSLSSPLRSLHSAALVITSSEARGGVSSVLKSLDEKTEDTIRSTQTSPPRTCTRSSSCHRYLYSMTLSIDTVLLLDTRSSSIIIDKPIPLSIKCSSLKH